MQKREIYFIKESELQVCMYITCALNLVSKVDTDSENAEKQSLKQINWYQSYSPTSTLNPSIRYYSVKQWVFVTKIIIRVWTFPLVTCYKWLEVLTGLWDNICKQLKGKWKHLLHLPVFTIIKISHTVTGGNYTINIEYRPTTSHKPTVFPFMYSYLRFGS